jgi:hypothetical protein
MERKLSSWMQCKEIALAAMHTENKYAAERDAYIYMLRSVSAEGATAASQIELSIGPLADVQDSLTAAFLEDLSQKIVQRAFPKLSQ